MFKITIFCLVLCFSACFCDLHEINKWIVAETQTEAYLPDFAVAYTCTVPEYLLDFSGALMGYTNEIFNENPLTANIWSTISSHAGTPYLAQPTLRIFDYSNDEEKFFHPLNLFERDALMSFRRSHNGIIRDIVISFIEEEGDHACMINTELSVIPSKYHEIITVDDIMPEDVTARDLEEIEDDIAAM